MERDTFQKRKKAILGLALLLIWLVFYYAYAPVNDKLNYYIRRKQKLTKKLNTIRKNIPSLLEKSKKIENLENEVNISKEAIRNKEKQIPYYKDIDIFTKAIVKLIGSLNLEGIKQSYEDSPVYGNLRLEIKLHGPLLEICKYLWRLELLGKFLKIDNFKITSSSDETYSADIFVQIITGHKKTSLKLGKKTQSYPFSFTLSSLKSKTTSQIEKELKLEGITYNERNPSCIINGEILNIGGEILGFEITNILPDRVILQKNRKEYILRRR